MVGLVPTPGRYSGDLATTNRFLDWTRWYSAPLSGIDYATAYADQDTSTWAGCFCLFDEFLRDLYLLLHKQIAYGRWCESMQLKSGLIVLICLGKIEQRSIFRMIGFGIANLIKATFETYRSLRSLFLSGIWILIPRMCRFEPHSACLQSVMECQLAKAGSR